MLAPTSHARFAVGIFLGALALPACGATTVPSSTSGGEGSGDDAGGSSGEGGDSGGGVEGGELRGIWVTRFTWSTQEQLEGILDEVAGAGFNTVFFQVRGNFDAYYASKHEPWAEGLSGTLGQDPGWDPLAVALTKGDEHGMDIHAYMNVFPYWRGEAAPASAGIPHKYTEEPDWVVVDSDGQAMELNSSYVFASPGVTGVGGHVSKVAADIDTNYDVAGIHLDYIRYPGAQYSHDAESLEAFAASGLEGEAGWAAFQRANVNKVLAGIANNVDVPVTAAVWGVYENDWGWSGVSQGNVDYYQDTRMFLEKGNLDAAIPMMYWPVTEVEGERLDFRTLVRDHLANAHGRHIYAGMGGEGVSYPQLVECVEAAREEGAQGVVVFDYSLFADHMDDIRQDLFPDDVEPPAMPWRN